MQLSIVALVFALVANSHAFVSPTPATSFSSPTTLELSIGEPAPDFALVDQNGKTIQRSAIKKPLVIYFYPADATPGCTKQAQSFNEAIADIRKTYQAEVVGISGQDTTSKQKFAQELGLDFSILADKNNAVRQLYNVPKAAFGLLPGRVTYVLGKSGTCVAVHNDLADATSHVQVAKEALQELPSPSPFEALFSR